MSSKMIDEYPGPLVQYEMVFPEQRLLLGTGAIRQSGSGEKETSDSDCTRVTNIHSIEWERHVDEADKLDYIVAVGSGVLAGLIDVFYAGEFSLDRASEWGRDKIEKVVIEVARVEGYAGDNLNDAIKTLEKKHPLAADGNTNDFGGGLQHHLRDFSHHFSIGGLFFSILTQFTGLVVGTDKAGMLHVVSVPESHKMCIGKNFQEKIVFGVIGWFFHMVSDMAGSSGSLMGGTGIPGPLVSFMKELSALPFFKKSGDGDMGFRLWVTKLFNGTLLVDRDETGKIIKGSVQKFDLRTEIGILGEIDRQVLPVLVNQCVVRSFYFCRRLAREVNSLGLLGISDLGRIAPEDILPWGTPTMRRMVTVSSGVFAGVDIADATVRAIKSMNPVKFFLRVNYVGVATFVISCVSDVTLERREAQGGESEEEKYERELSDLRCLKLDFQRARILHSLMRARIAYDIEYEARPRVAAKKKDWLEEGSRKIAEAVGLAWVANAGYFLEGAVLYDAIDKLYDVDSNSSWLWLVGMEAVRFKPYMPLHGDNDKIYEGLKPETDYLGDVFCERQGIVGKKELRALDKAVNSARGKLDGAAIKRVVGAAGTVVVVAATGGLAFYFAPAIAPVLAAALGAETASLSGAALTSASLAFLGGGSLAVGGAGMAGGTMLVAGSGALFGAVGGSGISAATSMALATNGSYVLDECAKLVAFCEEVLIKRYGDVASVEKIHAVLNQKILKLEIEIEAIKRYVPDGEMSEDDVDGENGDNGEIDPKKMIKILNRSHKFLRRSSDELAAVVKSV